MQEIGYIEAWQLWFSGQSANSFLLWGMQILWWGRLGKVVQLVSALTIVAEIVGPQRIVKFGKSLHPEFTFQRAWADTKRLFIDTSQNIEAVFRTRKDRDGLYYTLRELKSDLCYITSFLLSLLWYCYRLYRSSSILFMNSLMIEPLAWILERPYINNLIKVISILLLLIGFHFDPLAS